MKSNKEILVFADWNGLPKEILMGVLHSELLRGKEIFYFEYDLNFLQSQSVQQLDPDLLFFSGSQYLQNEKLNFGVFQDSSPDRWGRLLMRRRESAIARAENRPEKKLLESDYLLGVYDGHRMGGLRFKTDFNANFLDDNENMASPPWASLRELEYASLQLEKENVEQEPDYLKWLYLLMVPGSSLGGARPKASIIDTNKQLWVAKFPSANDDYNAGAWEKTLNTLAQMAGIQVPESKLIHLSGKYHTYLSKRFDRTTSGNRLHFASAMTMLGYNDGIDSHDGVSYLEIAEFISRNGASPEKDLIELWRRILFNVCVSNTDDHLRNHGFLLSESGWNLSPAFDMNPNQYGNGLKLNISENDNSQDVDLVQSVAPFFRVNNSDMNKINAEVLQAVNQWKTVASSYKLSPSEIDKMKNAFRI